MGTTFPIVSVVTPVYRSEDVLARALGGLLAQDLRDWEAIIVDDGSPESSSRIIQAYSWIDGRVKVVRERHGGACGARNAGIALARGEFLLFLDADDWLEPQALSEMMGCCRSASHAAVHGGLRYVMPDGSPTEWTGGYSLSAPLLEALAQSNVLSVPSSVLVRRSVLDQIGSFDPALAHCGDWDLWARLARHDGTIGRVPGLVTNYRMSPGSLSRSPRTLFRDAITVMRRIHSPDPRVRRPGPRFARGIDAERLAFHVAQFGAYAAALAASTNNFTAVESVLELVPRWTRLSPAKTGEFVFYAICFANCRGPEAAAEFWPPVAQVVLRLLRTLEERTQQPGFADEALASMDAWSEGRLSHEPSVPPARSANVESMEPAGMRAAHDTLAYETLRALASPSECS